MPINMLVTTNRACTHNTGAHDEEEDHDSYHHQPVILSAERMPFTQNL